jgi:small subunit ribosomal protein S17
MPDEQTTNPEESSEEPVTDETPVEETPVEDAPVGEATPEAPASDAPAEETAPTAEAEREDAPTAVQPAPKEKKKRKHVPRSERRQRPKVRRERPTEWKTITRLQKPESERGRRRERRGVVVSSAMDKTIVVKVDTIKAHPRYKKVVRRSAKFHAHDEHNTAKVGDIVRIVETRPLSKSKYWRLVEVVEAAR